MMVGPRNGTWIPGPLTRCVNMMGGLVPESLGVSSQGDEHGCASGSDDDDDEPSPSQADTPFSPACLASGKERQPAGRCGLGPQLPEATPLLMETDKPRDARLDRTEVGWTAGAYGTGQRGAAKWGTQDGVGSRPGPMERPRGAHLGVTGSEPAAERRLDSSHLQLFWANKGNKAGGEALVAGLCLSSLGARVSTEAVAHQGLARPFPKWAHDAAGVKEPRSGPWGRRGAVQDGGRVDRKAAVCRGALA